LKIQTLKPRVQAANLTRAQAPAATKRMRGGNLQRRNRKMFMRNPLCVICESQGEVTQATEWDHIVPLADGGGEHEGNLQGLCKKHHYEKSVLEAKRRWTY